MGSLEVWRRIDKLTALDKVVAQLIAIFYLTVSRVELLKALQKSEQPQVLPKGIALNRALDMSLIRLLKAGLIVEEKVSRGVSGIRMPPNLSWEAMQAIAEEESFPALIQAVGETAPAIIQYSWGSARAVSYDLCLREIRTGLFINDLERVKYFVELAKRGFPEALRNPPFVRLCLQPFRLEWFRSRSLELQAVGMKEFMEEVIKSCIPFEELLILLQEYRLFSTEHHGPHFRHILVVFLLIAHRLDEAKEILTGELPVEAPLCLRAWLAYLQGENDRAIFGFEESLKKLDKGNKGKTKKIFLVHPSGMFFILALLKNGSRTHRRMAMEYLDLVFRTPFDPYRHAYEGLFSLALVMDNRVRAAQSWLERDETPIGLGEMDLETIHRRLVAGTGKTTMEGMSPFFQFFYVLAYYWVDQEKARNHIPVLRELHLLAQENGHVWMARESAALLGVLDGQASLEKGCIVTVMRPKAMWEWALEALEDVAGELSVTQDNKLPKEPDASRVVWFISIPKGGQCWVHAKEQKWTSKGEWTRGRVLTQRTLRGLTLSSGKLSPQDMKLCSAVEVDFSRYGIRDSKMEGQRLLPLLVGHPLVFWEEEPTINVEVVIGEPELSVKEENGKVTMSFSQDASRVGAYAIRETPTRCRVVEILPRHKEVADILGAKGLEIPLAQRERILKILPGLSTLATLQSEIGGVGEHLPVVPASDRPRIHVFPYNYGLKIKIMIRPFGDEGPWMLPGQGATTLIADVAGQRVQTVRDLKAERSRAEVILQTSPMLAEGLGPDWEWTYEEPDRCLDLLLELHALKDGLELEWPEGQRMQVTRAITFGDMSLRFAQERDWFSLDGEVRVDESLVMSLQEVLKRMAGAEGRFVTLGEGRYLALTDEFRKRLAQLEAYSQSHGNKRQVHPLAIGALDGIIKEAGSCNMDQGWRDQLERLRAMRDWVPEWPSTFTADLRTYQKEGVRWLAQLAEWGAGACLADDMGLGKTLQALALLVMRAPNGPALVVAPTSVCMNWVDESRRWAPTLNVRLFGGAERQEQLDTLGPFDVMLCSYGLLQNESERFAQVHWRTVVLDEAQAIKNRMTKRSKAVMDLMADYKMVTTGTPIENHLGELWNIFQFINPGLLGSLERFNRRFAGPIERDGNDEARLRLRTLIRPFVLRRLKSQVLEELPPRTEITLRVELDTEERAFYEALRRNAVSRLSETKVSDEEKRFQILAEIMKLRRACCHPTLVAPDCGLQGAKLGVFWEVVEELLANGHKALVFSQFTTHLAIIRALLDQEKISYQYLDGATSPAARREGVNAFQAGKGDLFLISLKAGGLGLNLTAADYVIHMDPWWNPSVEDQASDRAHRFGQQRPVTVYRLVIRDSIEEKIVDLHSHKRDLADGLLDGSQTAGTISAEELMRLLSEE
ncbi:MAG: DEAD/DEAH box helicase [Magnetococcales bacterium]|nr:DEAD/DEAH box helicase [Magnetococcales bacterium]